MSALWTQTLGGPQMGSAVRVTHFGEGPNILLR